MRKTVCYWTNEKLMTEGLKFKTKSEWMEKSYGSYQKACKLGLIPLFTHFEGRKFKGYWTFERAKEAVNKYNNRIELFRTDNSLYSMINRKGWLNIFFPPCQLAKFECKRIAKKYETRDEWYKNDKESFTHAKTMGWKEDCTGHMKSSLKKRRTFEECKADAKKYKTRYEWASKSNSIYKYAYTHGWLVDCCKHMKRFGNSYGHNRYWTKERIQAEANKYDSLFQWRKKSNASYQAAGRYGCRIEIIQKLFTHRRAA